MSPEIQHKIFVSGFSLRRREEFIRPLLTASLGEKHSLLRNSNVCTEKKDSFLPSTWNKEKTLRPALRNGV